MIPRCTLLAAVLLFLPGPARANPISMDILRVRQMPSSLDVQVTHGVDSSAGTTLPAVKTIKRDGKELTGMWHSGTYKGNTGSGLVSLSARQFCDCGLTEGKHTYEVTVTNKFGGSGDYTYKSEVTVTSSPSAAKDAGTPASDLAPWEIPEPGQVQGVDCTQTCKGVSPGKDGGAAADKGLAKADASSISDGGAVKPGAEKADKGCSVSSSGSGEAGLTLLLLAFLALVLVRPIRR